MIDIENANTEFDKYVSNFNKNDGKIKLKIDHIKRVAIMSRRIAQDLNLSEEQIKLAELIGLFHDIGRFKQAELYDTFNDNFMIEEKYKKTIKLAVINHNKNKIDDNLNEEERLFSKIIRDADKLDIYYTIGEYDFPSIFWYKDFNCGPINEVIINDFINNHFVNYSNIKSNSDQILIFYAYIFDFNFDFSLKFLKKKKYLERFTDRVYQNFTNDTVKQQVKEIGEFSKNFIRNY